MKNGMIEKSDGKYWYKDGELHRKDVDEDGLVLPAVEKSDGTKYWYKDGELHREDRDEDGLVLPALQWADGAMCWYKEGKVHREDRDENGLVLPALQWADGTREWYKTGQRHREDRDEDGLVLPALQWADGSREWYVSGVLHREEVDKDGFTLPAIIHPCGSKQWYKVGKLHRMDGPAVIDGGLDLVGDEKELTIKLKKSFVNIVRRFTGLRKAKEKWFIEGFEVEKESHPWWIAQKEKAALIRGMVIMENEGDRKKGNVGGGGIEFNKGCDKETVVKNKKSIRL